MSVTLNNSYLDVVQPKSETIKTDEIIRWLEEQEARYVEIAKSFDFSVATTYLAKSAAYREVIEHILQ